VVAILPQHPGIIAGSGYKLRVRCSLSFLERNRSVVPLLQRQPEIPSRPTGRVPVYYHHDALKIGALIVRAPGFSGSEHIHRSAHLDSELAAVTMRETIRGGNAVMCQLKGPVVKSIHRPKLLRGYIIDAK